MINSIANVKVCIDAIFSNTRITDFYRFSFNLKEIGN